MRSKSTRRRAEGCLLGLATGDAVGTTLEFQPRGTFTPIDDMIGGGPFALAAGQWTDDTSMALCLAHSLLQNSGFDPYDLMNRFCNWRDYGYMSSTGSCFDIGNTVNAALSMYLRTGEPFAGSTDPTTAGNGSIMRLAPVVLYYYPDQQLVREYARASSRTTHGAVEAIQSCEVLAGILCRALSGHDKKAVLDTPAVLGATPSLTRLTSGVWHSKEEHEIRGTGYVVDSLEAAIWCFSRTVDFRECILAAANLGDDADTTAAVAGQIAGAFYGLEGIPDSWRSLVWQADEITNLASTLYERNA